MTTRLFILRFTSAAPSGLLARVAAVFADRGISLDQVLAASAGGQPAIILKATVDDPLAAHLRRRLARSPGVIGVEVRPGDGRDVWQALERPADG